jgi:glycosyltransferase involved in cell wall biosynthesis
MFTKFKTPEWVKFHNFHYKDFDSVDPSILKRIKSDLAKFNTENPEVSIVIPAYNEETSLLHTLSSLSKIKTKYSTQLIVVNNNSTDKTQQVLDACGVKSIFEPRQGISFTRQTGLESASGKYMLNADADSIYPETWVDDYVNALQDESVSCVYGSYSFIPEYSSRFVLANYELISEFIIGLRRFRKEYLNVLGFNFAFRRKDALKVGGFNTNRQRWQDGWMAMMLMKEGKLKSVKTARVWTSDRRLMYDGGIWNAAIKRLKKEITRYVPEKVEGSV